MSKRFVTLVALAVAACAGSAKKEPVSLHWLDPAGQVQMSIGDDGAVHDANDTIVAAIVGSDRVELRGDRTVAMGTLRGDDAIADTLGGRSVDVITRTGDRYTVRIASTVFEVAADGTIRIDDAGEPRGGGTVIGKVTGYGASAAQHRAFLAMLAAYPTIDEAPPMRWRDPSGALVMESDERGVRDVGGLQDTSARVRDDRVVIEDMDTDLNAELVEDSSIVDATGGAALVARDGDHYRLAGRAIELTVDAGGAIRSGRDASAPLVGRIEGYGKRRAQHRVFLVFAAVYDQDRHHLVDPPVDQRAPSSRRTISAPPTSARSF